MTLVAGAALVGALAGPVLSYPDDDGGPFAGGRSPRVFRIRPCAVLEHAEVGERLAPLAAIFARNDGRKRRVRMHLTSSAERPGLVMVVTGPEGNVLAGPRQISGAPEAMFAFWADLNGDGREDFIALVWSAESGSNLGFALSSKDGYAITSIMTIDPASSDFVDLGDGECRLVQTTLVRSPAAGEPGRPDAGAREFRVYNLMEFAGDRLVVSKADKRFPKWVSRPRRVTSLKEPDATRPGGKGTARAAELSADEKSRLWAAVPERIFWRPRRVALPKEPDATRPRAGTSAGRRDVAGSPGTRAPVLASAGE